MAKQSVVKSPNGHGPAESAPLRDKGAARIVDRAPKPKRRRSPIARAELVTRPERETRRDRWNMRLLRRLGYQDWESSARHEVEFIDSAPELAAAIRSGYPRFAHVALAGYLARSDDVPDAEREVLRTVYPDMYEQFERKNGRVLRWYSAKQVFAAAALTEHDDISVSLGRDLPAGAAEHVDLLRRCQQVAYTAWHRLTRYDRRQCQNMIFSVIEEALRQLDSSGRVRTGQSMKQLVKRLNDAEEFMLRCATRRAQGKYLKGMLGGTVVTGLVVGAVALLLIDGDHMTRLAGQLMLVATAGAVGAVVSVLWRMTSGSFRMNLPTLSHEMKGTDVRLVAGLRPVIGLVFALATITLVMGAVIPVDKQTGAEQTALFAGIGFLAGFSERLAQDMFVRSGQGLTGVMGDSPSLGPSAGILPPPGAQVGTGRGRRARER
jgi:hypothetical protein